MPWHLHAEGVVMKLSARNVLSGRVVKVIRGQTTANVKIVIKASDVIVAKD
jgi:molybdopterin-binding protein